MGYPEEVAELIAHSSNYVDTNNWNPLPEENLDTKNIIPSEELRKIRRLLHNLGDLSSKQIDCYSKCVLCLAQTNRNDPQLLGVLLHVLGDTYAHRATDWSGYGDYWGHAWAGTGPDDVRSDEYLGKERFSSFGASLYKNFALNGATPPELFYVILYTKDSNNQYRWQDEHIEDIFKAFATKSTDHTIDTSRNADLDAKISSLLPSLEACYEKARSLK